jgi:hypothetical protein
MTEPTRRNRHGLTIPRQKLKLRGLNALDMRTGAAKEVPERSGAPRGTNCARHQRAAYRGYRRYRYRSATCLVFRPDS